MKPIMFFLINNEEQVTINLVTQLLKEGAEEVGLQILIFQTFFQIFLVQILSMIFLKVLEEQEEEEDLRTLEVQI